MATITENLETLKANVARMKEAIGVPPETPLEDITKTVEDNSKTIQTGIYVVDDESELEELTAKEGELAIKYENTLRHPNATEALTSLHFPDIITLDTKVTTSTYVMYRDMQASMYRTRAYLTPSVFYIRDEYNYEYVVRYTSADSITYTKDVAYKDIMDKTFDGNQVMYSNTGEESLALMFVKSVDFKLWRYTEGSWNYADIGCNISEDQIFMPGEAYGNEGKIIGSLDKNEWRKNNIFVSKEEPEIKKGLWVKYTDSMNNPYNGVYTTNYKTAFTERDIDAVTPVNYYKADNFQLTPMSSRLAGPVYQMALQSFYIGSTSKGSGPDGILIGNTLYAFEYQYNSGYYNHRFCYALNLNTGSYTTKSAPTFGSINGRQEGPATANTSYIMGMFERFSDYRLYTYAYNISSNSWTYKLTSLTSNTTTCYVRSIISIDNGTRILMVAENSTVNDNDIDVYILNALTGSIESTWSYREADGYPSLLLGRIPNVLNGLSYTIEDGVLKSIDGTISLRLTGMTKETFIEDLRSLEHTYPKTNIVVYDKYIVNTNNIGTQNSSVYINNKAFRFRAYRPSGISSLSFMYEQNGVMYFYTGSSKKVYTIDLKQGVEYLPDEYIVIQTADNGTECEISQGLLANVKNVWMYNYSDYTINGASEIYIGDGTEWKLFKTNS